MLMIVTPTPVTTFGVRVAVTPAGRALTLRFTVPGVANRPSTLIWPVIVPPALTSTGLTDSNSEKSAGMMEKLNGARMVPAASDATTFMGAIAVIMSGPAVIVRVTGPDAVTGFWLKTAVA